MLTAVRVQSVGDVWARIELLARADEAGGVLRGAIATDADGTLWSGDVGEDLFHAFLSAGRVEPQAEEAMRREARAFHLSDAGRGLDVAQTLYGAYRTGGSYPEERICELMAWCFGGWKDAEMRDFARDVVETLRPGRPVPPSGSSTRSSGAPGRRASRPSW